MCCGTMGHQRSHFKGIFYGCHGHHCSDSRHSWTEEDRLVYLEQNLKDLRAEVKAAEARLKELKGER